MAAESFDYHLLIIGCLLRALHQIIIILTSIAIALSVITTNHFGFIMYENKGSMVQRCTLLVPVGLPVYMTIRLLTFCLGEISMIAFATSPGLLSFSA